CLATLYCEFCVRNYLKTIFSNWTSGNDDIDNLIQKCQLETLIPAKIVEWIPYNKLQNIRYLTKGGFSEIYTATWIDGGYEKWDSERQQLTRFGNQNVILKGLENVESANQSWFEEAKTHLTIGNKWTIIVQCYGLTQNITNGNYMLVIGRMDINLREYLYQNNNRLTWKEKINITFEIIKALYLIHIENAIHRDLHSGNILYSELNSKWLISDLGFCGPADKSSKYELEAFHSNKYDFNIPNNIDDFNKSSGKNDSMTSNINSKGDSKKLSKVFKKLQINDEIMQQTKGRPNIGDFNDEDETYNNPNFHSEEQNELEIPDELINHEESKKLIQRIIVNTCNSGAKAFKDLDQKIFIQVKGRYNALNNDVRNIYWAAKLSTQKGTGRKYTFLKLTATISPKTISQDLIPFL
ncbi:kinase-like protein, partial [Rhizophagus irregularis]